VTGARPAYSTAFTPDILPTIEAIPRLEDLTSDWAWGGSTGRGVRVAVIDSGIDADHPAVGGVQGYAAITEGKDGLEYDTVPHRDDFGHGTACAGIIRRLAPDCELYSVKVLGRALSGRGIVFAAGLRWAIEHGMQVCNLSLGTTKKDFFGLFHELADLAYFRNVALVAAANNMPVPSFPSVYAAVLSVAADDDADAERFYYNPSPPVEFGAPGIDVRVAWLDGQWLTATGNSFAAPHVTGLVARILGKHPGLTVFQLKTILRALAANVARQRRGPAGRKHARGAREGNARPAGRAW
jgi:subtilisin family serine protease